MNTEAPEPAILVAAQFPTSSDEQIQDSLDELASLARTAGMEPVERVVQRRKSYDPATLLGKGKIAEVERSARRAGATVVVFDEELTVAQQDRLASALDARVIDRTTLILEIFAMHAHTAEGRTQVELAQLSYLLPRIRGRGVELSRTGGGIRPMRGPGETKLEVDRRRIRRRMRMLERDISQMEAVRQTQRKRRSRAGLPSICLVGYTNSGKSSLLNRVTGAHVPVEDQLFSTLDSTTRRLELPEGSTAVLSDTVGFIRKLPHELVAAFHSTLEVVRDADLLLHVVDSARRDVLAELMEAVDEVLVELGAADIDAVLVMNKVDRLDPAARRGLENRYQGASFTSAVTGEGIEQLASAIGAKLSRTRRVTLRIPAARGDVIARAYREGRVTGREMEGETVILEVDLPSDFLSSFSEYMAANGS